MNDPCWGTRYFLLAKFGDIFMLMKKIFLLLSIISFSLIGCSNSNTNNAPNNGTIRVVLNMSNFSRYISSTKYEGFTGAAGYSPYEAWFELKGLLTIGIYDVTVTYTVDSTSYNFKLDASGSGKTDYFDRLVSSGITSVSGTVSYLEPNTKVDLDLSNFGRYVGYARKEGFTGAAGYSPYEAWLEFSGALSLGVYDVTVTYVVDNTSYNFKLDVSGGGKTNSFDRSLGCSISSVYGYVKYSA